MANINSSWYNLNLQSRNGTYLLQEQKREGLESWVWLAQLNCHLCFIRSQVMTLTLPLRSPDCQYFWALLSRMLSLSVALFWAIVKVCDPKTFTMTFFCEMYIIGLIDFHLNLWFSLPWGSTSCYSLHASLRWTVDIQIPVQPNKIQPHTLRCLTFVLMGASVPSIIVTTCFIWWILFKTIWCT